MATKLFSYDKIITIMLKYRVKWQWERGCGVTLLFKITKGSAIPFDAPCWKDALLPKLETF